MKTLKLILGIISCILCPVILFQSCAAGFVNVVEKNGSSSGTAGFIIAFILLAAGIVMIATRKSSGKGGSIACLVLLAIAAIIGFTSAGIYKDLYIWSGLAVAMAIINIIDMIVRKPEGKGKAEEGQAVEPPSSEK